MKKTQQGFTLIELMIVIAIIGILASVAIPQYQVYTQRAEATTSISAVRSMQLAIQEFAASEATLPDQLADLGKYGAPIVNTEYASGIVASATINATGDIVITYTTAALGAPSNLAGLTLILDAEISSAGTVTFTASTGSTIDDKYLPNMGT